METISQPMAQNQERRQVLVVDSQIASGRIGRVLRNMGYRVVLLEQASAKAADSVIEIAPSIEDISSLSLCAPLADKKDRLAWQSPYGPRPRGRK